MSTPEPRAGYLQAAGQMLLTVLHAPPPDVPARCAVLLCAPIGSDEVGSYRSRRQWAQWLAAAGHPALRFDLAGVGDSAGELEDPRLVDGWRESIAAAARLLAADGRQVAAVGLGGGALLALDAAMHGAPIGDLALWATPPGGRALVRELRAFARLEAGRDSPAEAGLPAGALAPGGFLLTAETIAALERIEIAAAGPPASGSRRVLLLGRDRLAIDPRLESALARLGAQVTTAPGAGYAQMTAEPDTARPAEETYAVVEAWLRDAPVGGARPGAVAPALRERLEVDVGGVCVVERPFAVAQPFGRLFGILSEPRDAPAGGRLTAVLLNAGAIRRSGPNRMWTQAARRWAARGVPTVRIDLEGIGDADGDARRYARVIEFYVPRLVAQVRATLDALEALGLPGRFLVGGLCSGAYWAFHAAQQDARVRAALLVNPRTLAWDDAQEVRREVSHLRLLTRGSTWRRLASGEVGRERLADFAGSGMRAIAQLPRRLVEREPAGATLDAALDLLRDRRQSVTFVFGEREPLRDELERRAWLRDRARWPNLDFVPIEGRDHTLRPPAMQRQAHAALDGALERALRSS